MRDPRKKTAVVIGAGPAGLSCAVKLARAGVAVEVFEASSHLGGMARSFELWGQTVDLGPHRFFSSLKIVNDHWLEFVGQAFTRVDRLTRIHYNRRFFYYPLKPWNAFKNMGPLETAIALVSYARSKANPVPVPKTLEEWVTNRFGKKLFSCFFKTYSEKLWGIPCSKLDADWAAQRIKQFSLSEAIKSAFLGDRGGKHKTLVDQFLYPNGGSGVVYQRMAEEIRELGGVIHLSSPVREVVLDASGKACGLVTCEGKRVDASHVVSTMPLTLMVKGLKSAPPEVVSSCDKLYYRNTILVYLEVEGSDLFPDQWIYIHSPEVLHGRITNFRNWSPSLTKGAKNSILCVEFWCFDSDPIWTADAPGLGQQAEQELRQIGVIPRDREVLNSQVVRLPRSYPVYERGYTEYLAVIQAYVNSIPGLLAIGRYGSFKYNNQDHSILMGLLAAQEILTGRSQDLWAVNTDSEYQEQARIDEVAAKPA